MSLGNEIKKKGKPTPAKPTEAKALVNKTVTLLENDWRVMQNHLMLLQENIGKCGLTSDLVGRVHSNCSYFINTINEQTNGK